MNVYDTVWVMDGNKPTQYIIFAVVESMSFDKKATEKYYHLVSSQMGAGWGMNAGFRFHEDCVFPTKNSLLDSFRGEE